MMLRSLKAERKLVIEVQNIEIAANMVYLQFVRIEGDPVINRRLFLLSKRLVRYMGGGCFAFDLSLLQYIICTKNM